ncbi:MAG: bis(5'-nucleosyl)-tetraphosphatase (symmetrical) YqeK [Clostridiales bacterium]|nr:bis(5'-nucleosyl)-tetraphosphatase (symmetrical) YqeK [Clostridiales bacterium]
MNEQIILFRRQLESTLDPMRYEHSLSVSYTCTSLAMRYQYDLLKAELAGLLHDCAKRYTDSQLISRCKKHGLILTDDELKAPAVIHAKYGSWMAENKFGIDDPDILSAIRWHTTGKADMSTLDKILYIADYIEPRRSKASNLSQVRYLAFQDLDLTMYEILADTIQYLKGKKGHMDSVTKNAYQYYDTLTRPMREKGDK